MFELVLLASIMGVFGVLTRAALEKESAKFCFFHSIIIAVLIVIFTFLTGFYVDDSQILQLQLRQFAGFSVFFAMSGYVLSDIIESITFLITTPWKNPLGIFFKDMRKRK
jgi:hypothetical protein